MVVRYEEICMSGGLVCQGVVHQGVQPDGREVIRDRALGLWGDEGVWPGPDSWGHGLRASPRALTRPAPPHIPRGQGAQEWPPRSRTPPGGGSGAVMCGSQTPMGLCT
jgi:hypothetical protein